VQGSKGKDCQENLQVRKYAKSLSPRKTVSLTIQRLLRILRVQDATIERHIQNLPERKTNKEEE
jgi:hypothetical protein